MHVVCCMFEWFGVWLITLIFFCGSQTVYHIFHRELVKFYDIFYLTVVLLFLKFHQPMSCVIGQLRLFDVKMSRVTEIFYELRESGAFERRMDDHIENYI